MAATTFSTITTENTERSVPAVTLTIIPPSRPQTPQPGYRAADNGADSLPLSSPSSLSPTFISRPSSVSDASDDGMLSCTTSTTNLSIADEEYGARSTVYHIYRVGTYGTNFTVHTVKDTKLIEQLREEIGPVVLDRGCGCPASSGWAQRALWLAPPKKKVKADDNKTDPRKAAYYLHSPIIWFHEPPQTLRFGGDKSAPVVCLIKGSFFWRTWRFDFVVPEDDKEKGKKKNKDKDQEKPKMGQRIDSGFDEKEDEEANATNKEPERRWRGLNEPGVIDPRGVLVSKYPLRAHRIGETGKEYTIEEIKRRKSLPITPEQINNRISQSNSFSGKARGVFRSRSSSLTTAPPPTPEPEFSEMMTPAGPEPQDLPDHLKPDSLEEGSLLMKWSGWLTRQYEFVYRGVDFRWKGTGTVKDEKTFVGPWSAFNHLKLIAILPDDGELGGVEQEEKGLQVKEGVLRRRGSFSSFVSLLSRRDSGTSATGSGNGKIEGKGKRGRQVVIAKYTCLAALRKAGRLIVYDYGLEQATSAYLKFLGESELNTEKERLRHLVVATALCMLQGEKEKRETIIQIVEAAAGAA